MDKRLALKKFIRLYKFYGKYVSDEASLEYIEFISKYDEERVDHAINQLIRYKNFPSIYQMERVFSEQHKTMPMLRDRPVKELKEHVNHLEAAKPQFHDSMMEILGLYYEQIEERGQANIDILSIYYDHCKSTCAIEDSRQLLEVIDEYKQKYSREDVKKKLQNKVRILN